VDLLQVSRYYGAILQRWHQGGDRFDYAQFISPTCSFRRTAAPMTRDLIALSASIQQIVASAAPLLCAIGVGPDRHIAGMICGGDTIVTTGQALPPLGSYTVVLANSVPIAARPGSRDPDANLAVLHIDTPWPAANPRIATCSVGSLVIVLGAGADASPTVRLTVVHRFTRTGAGLAPVLDLPADSLENGSLVLDTSGRLIGLAAIGPNGEPMAIPSAVIGRILMPDQSVAPAQTVSSPHAASGAPSIPEPASNRRGWLGVALQPVTVPDRLVARTGQSLGRMVVSITKGGPAEISGIRIGDVLLTLNGTSVSGPQALRAFVGAERVGTTVEVKLLRDRNVMATSLTIACQAG
jgi:S1-C subfamily serine protease